MKTIILLSFIIILGCNQSKEVQTICYPKTIAVNFSNAVDLFSSELIDGLRLIQLETTGESMIGEIHDIYVSTDNIYILDQNNIKTVLRFSKDGEFLTKYGYTLPPDPPGDLFSSIEKHAAVLSFFENRDYFIASITQRKQVNGDPSLFFIIKHLASGKVRLIRMPDSFGFVESFNFPLFLEGTNEIVFSIHPVDLHLNTEALKNQPLLNHALSKIEPIDESSNPILVFAKINNSFFN